MTLGEMAQDWVVRGKGDIDELKKQLHPSNGKCKLIGSLRFHVSICL